MGDNYGLNDSYEYFEFELDSLDATTSGVGGVSSTDWPLFYVAAKGPLEDVAAMKILEAQIPFSWYVFNSRNTTFILTESGFSPVTVTLPIGNYTATQTATNIGNALTAVSPSSKTYYVFYDTNTQKFLIVDQASSPSTFTLTFGSPTNSGNINPRLYIGFPPGATSNQGYSNTTVLLGNTLYGPPDGGITTIGNYLITPNVQLTSGPNYLYVNSTKLGSDIDVYLPAGAFNLGGGKAGVQVAKIPITVNSDGVIEWKDPDPQKWFKYDAPQALTSLDFYLSLGNTTSQIPLQLNGIGFSLKLGVLRRLNTNVFHGQGTSNNGRVTNRSGPKRIGPYQTIGI